MQWTNFYLRSGLDTSLLPPDNELQKWSVHATARELPLDSTFVLRASWGKTTDNLDLGGASVATPWNSSLKPATTSTQSSNLQPTAVGYLITAPTSSTFDGEEKTTSVQASITSTLMANLESRVYYNYYDKANDSTPIGYAPEGSQGTNCANPPANSSTCYTHRGAGGARTLRLHEERGRHRSHLPDRRASEAGGQLHLAQDRP